MNPVDDYHKIGLVSTLHDPEGKMVPFLSPCLPTITALYHSISVVATRETASSVVEILRNAGIEVLVEGTTDIGINRRLALAQGLVEPLNKALHYCDFDRLLFWILNFPAELYHLISNALPPAGYLVIGRTEAAFRTHPLVQQQLEGLTNRVFSHVFGREMDVTAGSCALSRPVTEFILANSTEPSNATDTEWPMLVRFIAKAGFPVQYLAVDGLAYETATFWGMEALSEANNSQNWQRRVTLAYDSIFAVLRLDAAWTSLPSKPPED